MLPQSGESVLACQHKQQGTSTSTRRNSAMDLNQLSFEFGQEIPSTWDFGVDVLDGFEQFMDTTPNLDPAVSYGAQRVPEANTASRTSSDDASNAHVEHTSKGRLSAEKKQQNNRAAQKRFRQRQKVLFSLPQL